MIQNYSDLTYVDMTLDASESSQCQYVSSNNHGTINITGNTNIYAAPGQVAFDVCYWGDSSDYASGVTVNIDTTGTIEGKIEYSYLNATVAGKGGIANKAKLNIANGTINGSITLAGGASEADKPNITITGGSFKEDVKKYVDEGHDELVTKRGSTPYIVGKFSDGGAASAMGQQTVYKVTQTNSDGELIDVYYLTEKEAQDAAGAGGTVITVTRPSTGSSSSSSQKTPYQEERPFWDRVVNRIEDAEAGDTVKANAESCTLVPFDVLDALRGKDVTLVITSRTTPDIVIHGEDVLSTDGVLYYSMKELYNLYKDLAAQEEEAPAGSSTINPETGGILEVTFSDVVPQAAAPAAEMPAAPAEAPLVDEPAQNPADTVISAQADPAEGASALPAQEASFPVVPVLVAAAALAVAGALGFVWYRQR